MSHGSRRTVREVHFTYARPRQGGDDAFALLRPDRNGVPVADFVAITPADIQALAEQLDLRFARRRNNFDRIRAEVGEKLYRARDNRPFEPELDALFWPDALNPEPPPAEPLEVVRRLAVSADAEACRLPVEALTSGSRLLAAEANAAFSVVRRIGPEPAGPRQIPGEPRRLQRLNGPPAQPLRMLIVFSCDDSLGRLAEQECGSELTFVPAGEQHGRLAPARGRKCPAEAERLALDRALAPLVRRGWLEVHFHAGCACGNGSPPHLITGKLTPAWRKVRWEIGAELPGARAGSLHAALAERFLGEKWDIFHYFGHGREGAGGPALALEPEAAPLTPADINVWLDKRVSGDPWRSDSAPRIVTLQACGAAGGANAAIDGFPGAFCKWGTNVFIGSQMRLSPDTATAVTRHVYRELAESLFTDPLDAEVGMHQARLERRSSADYFCPVIYSRPVNGPIFRYEDKRLERWQKHRKRQPA